MAARTRLAMDWAELPGSTNSRAMGAFRRRQRFVPTSRWVAMELPSSSMSMAVFICRAVDTRRYSTASDSPGMSPLVRGTTPSRPKLVEVPEGGSATSPGRRRYGGQDDPDD